MITHDEMIKKMLQNPEVKTEYERLQPEFALLRARLEAGKTQDEVAQLMHTSKSAISRLENSSGKSKHTPSIATLRRYAEAIGYDLVIQLVPHNKPII